MGGRHQMGAVTKKESKHPCKEVPGNTWHQFEAHGQTVGFSGPEGLELQLVDEVEDGQRTLRVTYADGSPVLDAEGRRTGVWALGSIAAPPPAPPA